MLAVRSWRPLLFQCILCVTFAAFSAAASDIGVRIEGNRVIPDPIIKSALGLGRAGRKRLTKRRVRKMEQRLVNFLKRAGYDLARARVFLHDGMLHVLVEEGRLDKIVFIGQSNWKTFNLRLEFELPGMVYNRFQIASELKRLKEKYGFENLWPEVVELKPGKSLLTLDGVLDEVGLKAFERMWFKAKAKYELRIRCTSRKGTGGADLGLFYRSPYGMNLKLQYDLPGAFFTNDRFKAAAEAAAWTQSSILSGRNDFTLTHAGLVLQWYTPGLGARWLRARLDASGEVFNLQRADIGVDSYWRFLVSPSLVLAVEPAGWFRMGVGVGYAFEALVFLEKADDAPSFVSEGYRSLPVFKAGMRFTFGRENNRLDKEHFLSLGYKDYRFFNEKNVDILVLKYQKFFSFGYDELCMRLTGVGVWGGGVEWMDEASLTTWSMRSVAGESRYARKYGEAGLEFRVALVRDLFKVGVFAETGVFAELDRDRTGREKPGVLFAFGPTVHLLLLDTFQLDVYYGFGFREDGDYRSRVSFDLRKAF